MFLITNALATAGHLLNIFAGKDRRQLVSMIEDLQECSDDVISIFAKHFGEEIILNDVPLHPSSAHALARLLRLKPGRIALLDLHNCYPSLHSLKLICDAITDRPNKVSSPVGPSRDVTTRVDFCITHIPGLQRTH